MKTWIVVSDASRARLFMKDAGSSQWVKFEELDHPPSRWRAKDLVTDRQGRNSTSSGRTGKTRQTTSPTTSPLEVEEQRFAHQLGKLLNDAHAQNAFDQLVLIAEPHFLGLLRQELAARVHKSIYATINKDYAGLDEATIAERVLLP